MARFGDIPCVLRSVGPVGFLKRVWNQISEDGVFTWASALAYSWLFAIFPFFIFVLTLLPYLPERAKIGAREEIEHGLRQLPQAAYETIAPFTFRTLNTVLEHRPSAKALLSIGIALTLWAASGGMAATMAALDKCYDIEKGRPWWKMRLIAIFLTIAVATLLLAVILLVPVGTVARNWFVSRQALSGIDWTFLWIFDLSRWLLSLVFLFLALAIVYHWGVSLRGKWRAITPGSAFCVAAWLGLGMVFRIYINQFGRYNETYGTVGGVAVLLLLFYLDAVVLLVGAEIDSEIDFAVLDLPNLARAGESDVPMPKEADAAANATAIDDGLAAPIDGGDGETPL